MKTEDGRWENIPDFGGKGLQIAKEINVCSKCFPNYHVDVEVVEIPYIPPPEDEQEISWRERNRAKTRRRDYDPDEEKYTNYRW